MQIYPFPSSWKISFRQTYRNVDGEDEQNEGDEKVDGMVVVVVAAAAAVVVVVVVVVAAAARIKTGSNCSILSILLFCITPIIHVKSIFNNLTPMWFAVNMATLPSVVDT